MVNCLGLSLPRKSVIRLTDHLNMTVIVDWDVKPQNKTTTKTERNSLCLFMLMSVYFQGVNKLSACPKVVDISKRKPGM